MIHRQKNRPALQRRDILTVSLEYFFTFTFGFFIGNLLNSLVVILFIIFYTAPFSSKHFILGLFVRSLST